jgi:transcriptional regulator with XRE-family HTH domain
MAKNKKHVGKRLQALRESQGKCQEDFAKELGIPYSTYFQYEQGFRIGTKHIDKIQALLDLTAAEVIEILRRR